MREVIAICRSAKKSRMRVAKVLDRYFWRIGDRTWRGKATNACLDRVSRELRKSAKRNTAVVIHEIRSSHDSRLPIIRIGSRFAFSDEGLVPVASNPAEYKRKVDEFDTESAVKAAVCIAALFHDLGKATVLFQEKLRNAIKGGKPAADSVRHEVFSAAVWDKIFGDAEDAALADKLISMTPEDVDAACSQVIPELVALSGTPNSELSFSFLAFEGRLTHLIGMLIMTHHRLPDGDTDLLTPLASRHAHNQASHCLFTKLAIAPGQPFWYEAWWLEAIVRSANNLNNDGGLFFSDIVVRASLMLADHLGSFQKERSATCPEHLANTTRRDGDVEFSVADSLSKHVSRVYRNSKRTLEIYYRYRDAFPGIDVAQLPVNIAYPRPSSDERFAWQYYAAEKATQICETSEGGFFACLVAGTGSGKTRAAPTILANAAMADVRSERRYFRVNLALGLRVLATQSAHEYTTDLGFSAQDVAVLVGQIPLEFSRAGEESSSSSSDGSESLMKLPDWLQVEQASGAVPDIGDPREDEWLRTLSMDTERGLPAICELVLDAAGKRNTNGRRLITPPVLVGTIDHFMGVAAPLNSRFLIQSIRIATSDLIIDEIDQFNGEDVAAIGRLIYQSGSMGRRVVIMSATLTLDITEALYSAYKAGWAVYSCAHGVRDHVNILVTGDSVASCSTNGNGGELPEVFGKSRDRILQELCDRPVARSSSILPPCDTWDELVSQIDHGCSRLHDLNAVSVKPSSGKEYKVSVGLVRLTRISHTAGIAAQLPSGDIDGRLRVTLCLHSQFPRLHRGWIETRLRRALTRKGIEPDTGVTELCRSEGLFRKADEIDVTDIEIVVITSPVIETGNDLDFDWAILDPVSVRSIIQSAGRVWRHRLALRPCLNVLILGRSVVAMEGGKIRNPGIETPLAAETMVATPSLADYERRDFKLLAGDFDFARIDASAVLSGSGDFPLRDAESELQRKMISADSDVVTSPLGRYIQRINSRLTRAMFQTRKFRRSSRRTIVFKMIGEDFLSGVWYLNLAPCTRHSVFSEAEKGDLEICNVVGFHLFGCFADQAWSDLSGGAEITPNDVSRLMQVELPSNGYDEIRQGFTYTSFTGFTRGCAEDLFQPFGRALINQ